MPTEMPKRCLAKFQRAKKKLKDYFQGTCFESLFLKENTVSLGLIDYPTMVRLVYLIFMVVLFPSGCLGQV